MCPSSGVLGGTFRPRAVTNPPIPRPLHEGFSGALWNAAKVFTAASLADSLIPGRSRAKRVLAGTFGTRGSFTLGWAVFLAGRNSALDNRAAFHQPRSGFDAAEGAGRGAVADPPRPLPQPRPRDEFVNV